MFHIIACHGIIKHKSIRFCGTFIALFDISDRTNTKNLSDGDKDMEKILKRLEDCSEDEEIIVHLNLQSI